MYVYMFNLIFMIYFIITEYTSKNVRNLQMVSRFRLGGTISYPIFAAHNTFTHIIAY